ncbi:membrane protein [Lysobacter arseniciresistens ZS79]|uniref:Membrane protein n=1 Tax=Lysobacter arseniciresistens ZS79 TaxID=913325 RepID=A0A0A0F5P1_9GAMM|nr:drug/metabolite exporter YedA [Lysobacter arseniciresistens]KGM57805.1 membrane protein [Lysobacter arseniciresistens ZS79]
MSDGSTPAATAVASPAAGASLDPRVMIPLALLTLYVVWGSTYLGILFALESYPPFLLAGMRFLGAGVAMYAFLRWRGHATPTRLQWRNAAITGVLLLGFGNGLVCFAEERVSSGIAAVAVSSMPLFAAAFSGMYGQWPTRREIVGLLVGFAGVVVLNLGSSLSGERIGAIALLTAAAAWAFGSVWSKRQEMPAGPMNTAAQMLCASVALLLVGFGTGEALPASPTLKSTLALVYLALFGSILAFSAYLYVLKHARPAVATSYAYVNPPVAVLFGVLLAGEVVGPWDMLGMVVILAGVAVITLGGQAKRGSRVRTA